MPVTTPKPSFWGLTTPLASSTKLSLAPTKLVGRLLHLDKARAAFKTDVRLSLRIALGVLLAGVVQTHAPSESGRTWFFLPKWYYINGLSWAAVMTIYAASRHVGGAVRQLWQINTGVAVALLFSFVVSSLVSMDQTHLVQASINFNGTQYDISLHDWGKIAPLIVVFTFVLFVSPTDSKVKKFAVSTNLYFMLVMVSPMDPVKPSQRRDMESESVQALMKNFAAYCAVGVVGTFISLATMLLPYPLFAICELKEHIKDAPMEIREIMNLAVDAYCFRARDIREMDFFRLRLRLLTDGASARMKAMEKLLDEAWWEERVGAGWYFNFNRPMSTQFVDLYGRMIKDLNAMQFAIELETCPGTHVTLMKKLQRSIYLVQIETNDLFDEISRNVLSSSTTMPSARFARLRQNLSTIMKTFTELYGELLANDSIKTPSEVACSMPLSLFLYSLHTLVQTLCEFEHSGSKKETYSTKRSIVKQIGRSLLNKDAYPLPLVLFSLRTTLCIAIGVCFSTFVFAFSSIVPATIAMVADNYRGGTHANMVNRISGLVAGTVVPSVVSFFICKAPSNVAYNAFNNIALCIWTTLSMYVYYSGSYIKSAGKVSAFMAASVFLDHSCRNQFGFKAVANSSLTENSLGVMILIVIELVFRPQSARTLLRENIRTFLRDYGRYLNRVCRHHLAVERGVKGQLDDILDAKEAKALRKQIDCTFRKHLEQQAQLVHDASREPELWRPLFSVDKHRNILTVCENLLAHLRILADLVEWQARRRDSEVDCLLRQSSRSGSFSVKMQSLVDAQRAWHASQDDYAKAVLEALETLLLVFDDTFAQSDTDQKVLFMQMKEAFRQADVDRSGEVDTHQLALLLDKLVPVTVRGDVHMDQYVVEFLRKVDHDHDGKVSYAEFMDALTHGFRLELEIDEGPYNSREVQAPHLLLRALAGVPTTSDLSLDDGGTVLLNVESFSIKDAAARLRTAYGAYLLVRTVDHHVAVEDWIVMSCLLCTTDEIAARLALLSTWAAT